MGYAVRKYRAGDRGAVRRICCDTALLGGPVDKCCCDRDIAADILIAYYTDFEPESLFVAEAGGEIAGYVAGCLNPRRRRRALALSILPSVGAKIIAGSPPFKKQVLPACLNFSKALLRGEFFYPDLKKSFPASMHINVDRGFRNMGIGAALVDCFLLYLKRKNIRGVHLLTRSDRAAGFFAGRGFKLIHSKPAGCMEYLGCGKLKLSVMGREL